ncbi:beta-1,6-glucan synthase [Pseudoxanthobacter sp.]|uniref:glycoside hydrolase family 17 protein n=1 Tax=Pseudoxanthobacter sp. TaxID=1925742 RepID=UPI002FE16C38
MASPSASPAPSASGSSRSVLVAALAVVVLVAAGWWWLGRPVAVPPSPLAPGEEIACLSYAPYEGSQTPFDPNLWIAPEQIDRQLGELAKVTSCVRTYSTGQGLAAVPEIAARHGLKVLQGIWLGRNRTDNAKEIAAAIELAKAYPDSIRGFVVGNEVLLRRDLPPETLVEAIRTIRKAVAPIPVTYADVWEFWERNTEIARDVDFVTIHILPYWEDQPVNVSKARDHVADVRREMGTLFGDKPILIGETGWPSRGRMREGALPTPANQVAYLSEIIALAKKNGWDYNLIEALDQPWKRKLEGTVGGRWGVLDDAGKVKFHWGEAISNHPGWLWQAAIGIVAAAVVMGLGLKARGMNAVGRLSLIALVTGFALPWWLEEAPVVSLDGWDWAFAAATLALTVLMPLAAAPMVARGIPRLRLEALLGSAETPAGTGAAGRIMGWLTFATLVIGVPTLIALLVDSRYRDFQFAAFAGPAIAVAMVGAAGAAGRVERLFSALILVTAIGVILNEGADNGQAWAFALDFIVLALALRPVGRGTPAPAGQGKAVPA